jgi:hypothetical protein
MESSRETRSDAQQRVQIWRGGGYSIPLPVMFAIAEAFVHEELVKLPSRVLQMGQVVSRHFAISEARVSSSEGYMVGSLFRAFTFSFEISEE